MFKKILASSLAVLTLSSVVAPAIKAGEGDDQGVIHPIKDHYNSDLIKKMVEIDGSESFRDFKHKDMINLITAEMEGNFNDAFAEIYDKSDNNIKLILNHLDRYLRLCESPVEHSEFKTNQTDARFISARRLSCLNIFCTLCMTLRLSTYDTIETDLRILENGSPLMEKNLRSFHCFLPQLCKKAGAKFNLSTLMKVHELILNNTMNPSDFIIWWEGPGHYIYEKFKYSGRNEGGACFDYACFSFKIYYNNKYMTKSEAIKKDILVKNGFNKIFKQLELHEEITQVPEDKNFIQEMLKLNSK